MKVVNELPNSVKNLRLLLITNFIDYNMRKRKNKKLALFIWKVKDEIYTFETHIKKTDVSAPAYFFFSSVKRTKKGIVGTLRAFAPVLAGYEGVQAQDFLFFMHSANIHKAAFKYRFVKTILHLNSLYFALEHDMIVSHPIYKRYPHKMSMEIENHITPFDVKIDRKSYVFWVDDIFIVFPRDIHTQDYIDTFNKLSRALYSIMPDEKKINVILDIDSVFS